MKQLYLMLLAVIPLFITAQIPESLLSPKEKIMLFDEYQGSIYETLKYQKSSLIDENSTSYETRLRYDIYSDVIEFKKDDDVFQIAQKESVYARIGSDLYYYCEFKNRRGLPFHGYFVLVDQNDDYRVYKRYSLQIKEPEKKGISFGELIPGNIRQIATYFLEHNGRLIEIPTSKKDFFDLFDDKKSELQNFITSQKLKLKKEEDLIALMSKYNELINSNGEILQTVLAAKIDD